MPRSSVQVALDPLIARTVARLGRQAEFALSKVDLTTAQYRVLSQLAEGSEASSSLAEKLSVSRPTVTMVVEGLVQRGLVDRQQRIDDRRRVAVTLTETGSSLLAEADRVVLSRLAEILSELPDADVATALRGLDRWRAAIEAHRARVRAKPRQPELPV
jgi:long-chain acyl-CoA synthetase